jgi:hypothetical protein
MVRKSKNSRKSTASSLDVRTPKEIPMLEKLLSKGPMAMVLVYADWCGHCTQFKEKVWNQSTLSKTKNINTAAVHYDMLDQTSLKNTKVNGYPSMFLVGNDKEAKEIPTPQTTEELLKFDTTSANALNTNKNSPSPNVNSSNVNMDTDADTNVNEYSPSPNMNTPLSSNSYTPGPPDSLDDVVTTAETNETEKQMQTGGSLFDILSRYNAQQGGRSKRKTSKSKSKSKRKNRRALTRKRQ